MSVGLNFSDFSMIDDKLNVNSQNNIENWMNSSNPTAISNEHSTESFSENFNEALMQQYNMENWMNSFNQTAISKEHSTESILENFNAAYTDYNFAETDSYENVNLKFDVEQSINELNLLDDKYYGEDLAYGLINELGNSSVYVDRLSEEVIKKVEEIESRNQNSVIKERLESFLVDWYYMNRVSKNSLTSLLHGLNEIFPHLSLALDSKTLLKTPKSLGDFHSIAGGVYSHFGLKKCIVKFIEKRLKLKIGDTHIRFLANVDGSPTAPNSSKQNIWPILCSDELTNDVEIIGIYLGQCDKPEDPNAYLKMFVEEYLDLLENLVEYNGVHYTIELHALICDAQAKAFALCTKYPSGFLSCSKCTEEGHYYKCVCFTNVSLENIEHRTDEKFRNFAYTEVKNDYQRKKSVLNEIPNFGLVTNVPLDAMHLLYIG